MAEERDGGQVAQHTPGPWVVANGHEVHDRETRHDARGARVGDTPNRIVRVEYPYGDRRGLEANARLIAAAPDLLAALKAVANRRIAWPAEIERQVRAAIARAQGSSPRRCYDGCRDHLYHTDMGGGWYEVYSVSDGMCGHVEIENCDPDSPDYSSFTSFHWSVTSPNATSQEQARQAARDWLAAGAPEDDDAPPFTRGEQERLGAEADYYEGTM